MQRRREEQRRGEPSRGEGGGMLTGKASRIEDKRRAQDWRERRKRRKEERTEDDGRSG